MHQQPVRFSLDLHPTGAAAATVGFHGHASFSASSNPTIAAPQIQPALMQATQTVLQARLHANQLAMPTLESSLPHLTAEILAQLSPLSAQGITVHALHLHADVPAQAIAPAAGQVMSGSEIAANVAGNFAGNALSSALDSVPRPRVTANVGGMKLRVGPGADSIGDQVGAEIKDRLLTYAIVGGVLLFVTGICVISVAAKLLF